MQILMWVPTSHIIRPVSSKLCLNTLMVVILICPQLTLLNHAQPMHAAFNYQFKAVLKLALPAHTLAIFVERRLGSCVGCRRTSSFTAQRTH